VRILIGAFLEDQPLGERWARYLLPDLLTLVDPVDVDAGLGQVEAAVEVALSAYGPLYAEGGDDVTTSYPPSDVTILLEDDGTLTALHRDLVRGLLPVLADPDAVRGAYRPGIDIRSEDRVERGDELEFDAVAVLVLDADADEWELAAQFPLI
jgi:hypothetical protein